MNSEPVVNQLWCGKEGTPMAGRVVQVVAVLPSAISVETVVGTPGRKAQARTRLARSSLYMCYTPLREVDFSQP